MSSIDVRKTKKSTRYRARVTYRGETISRSFNKKSDAQTWANELERSFESGITGIAERNDLKRGIELYLLHELKHLKDAFGLNRILHN